MASKIFCPHLVNVSRQPVVEVLQALPLLRPGQLDAAPGSWPRLGHVGVGVVVYTQLAQTPASHG